MKEIEIKLFGGFRKYVPAGKIKLQVDERCTAMMLKERIHEELRFRFPNYKEQNLVFESALATDGEVLTDEAIINEHCSLALLPPVCGG